MKAWIFGTALIANRDDVWNYLDAITSSLEITEVTVGSLPIGTEKHVVDWCNENKINYLEYREPSVNICNIQSPDVGIAFLGSEVVNARNRLTADILSDSDIKIYFVPSEKKSK